MLYYSVWSIRVVVVTFVVFEDLMGRLKIYFYIVYWLFLEVCDNKRGMLRKEFEPEMWGEQTRKGKKDKKE